jgi:hypothetical protein
LEGNFLEGAGENDKKSTSMMTDVLSEKKNMGKWLLSGAELRR